jgi:integrase/recombinase XerD
MPKKGQHTPRVPLGDVRDPQSLHHYMCRFSAWLREKNYSDKTIASREVYLRFFIAWCLDRGIARPQDVTRAIIERYQSHLFVYRKKDGQPLSTSSQHVRITPLRAWFKWLARQNFILYNPASDLELPRMEKRLPKHILSVKEAETVLAVPDLNTTTGMRDRAMLEVLYSTGMRRMELINLKLHDIDAERGTVMIRQGKGKKDRMIPIGERAIAWVDKYRDDVRAGLSTGADEGTLFLTHLGEAFTSNRLTQMVRDYIVQADIGKTGSCHLFRHTMATLMLENGADIRYIQAMLGHAELSTTQIYTQVSIRQLKAIHTATHPGRLPGTTGEKSSALGVTPQPEPLNAAVALLMALEEEGQEEERDQVGADVAADASARR